MTKVINIAGRCLVYKRFHTTIGLVLTGMIASGKALRQDLHAIIHIYPTHVIYTKFWAITFVSHLRKILVFGSTLSST